jgi:hypothetical protein
MIFDPDQVIEPGTCALLHCGTWRALPLSSIGHRIRPKSVGTTHPRCDLGSDGTWTPLKTMAVAGVPMERGVRFSRGQLHSGIDVAEYLDGLAINYPLSVQGS